MVPQQLRYRVPLIPFTDRSYTSTILSSLQFVGIEVLTAVVIKFAIFWDIAPCSPYMNRRFGGTYHLHLQGANIKHRFQQLLHCCVLHSRYLALAVSLAPVLLL
jgi:hypothetical protein